MSSLLSLPNELLSLIANPLNKKDINSLLQTNRQLASLLTPHLHKLATRDVGDMTKLQWAVLNGYKYTARAVLESGADINYIPPPHLEKLHKTALHIACENGDIEVVELLLAYNADVSVRTPCGTTALHWAVKGRSVDVVVALLRAGADVAVIDENGNSPLVWAVGYGLVEVVRVLLEGGAGVGAAGGKGVTPLHWAVRGGDEGAVRVLVAYGADMEARDKMGRTPGECAALDGSAVWG